MARPTQPAHALLHDPLSLAAPATVPDVNLLRQRVESYARHPFNERQFKAFRRVFQERVSLLLGPPGTGKSDVAAATVLGRLEQAFDEERPVAICIGSSNWDAIDNVLEKVADLLDTRASRHGAPPIPVRLVRLRSSSGDPPRDSRVEDVERRSTAGKALAEALTTPDPDAPTCFVVGSTYKQLSNLAEGAGDNSMPRARWFDLLVIDEASQVPVADAVSYFLLLKPDAHVLVAGDPHQLGPIYSYDLAEIGSQDGLLDCIFTYYQDRFRLQPTQLNRTYRCNEPIVAWPRVRFYRGDYDTHVPTRQLTLTCPAGRPSGWPATLAWHDAYLQILDPTRPVVVLTYPGQPYTLANPFEAQTVAALAVLYYLSLGQNGAAPDLDEFWRERLGVVTPHRAQRALIRNLLADRAGLSDDPAVDTVDRFQGRERDCMIASYGVADKDFAASEDAFILSARRFNVTLTRARAKFILLISEALLQYLPGDLTVASDAAHLQRFVRAYCRTTSGPVSLPFDGGTMPVHMRWP